jgi:hypothetical protein
MTPKEPTSSTVGSETDKVSSEVSILLLLEL